MATIDSKIPEGALAEKWTNYKAHQKLVNPANKRRLDIIVGGTGLAGASAAASLGALGFKVLNFCIQDSPRRAHSIAAQGGINAAKNYQNDGDSVYRLFYDTIKGGDYRAREANVYRLAEVSNAIIDQCVAQGVPFAREYGGLLDNRSFGGAQVSRTFYARGQTGQQLLLGAYSALSREVQRGNVKLYTRYEMLDVVLIKDNEGVERARGIIARNLVTGKIERFAAHAVVIGTGGYGNTYFLSTNAMASNGSAAMQVYRKGAYFANPCFAQIHPTCIPVHGDKQSKLTLMSESLRNDGRIWVPKKLEELDMRRFFSDGIADFITELAETVEQNAPGKAHTSNHFAEYETLGFDYLKAASGFVDYPGIGFYHRRQCGRLPPPRFPYPGKPVSGVRSRSQEPPPPFG